MRKLTLVHVSTPCRCGHGSYQVFITLPADEYDVVKRTDDGDVFIDEEAMRQLRLALPGYHF